MLIKFTAIIVQLVINKSLTVNILTLLVNGTKKGALCSMSYALVFSITAWAKDDVKKYVKGPENTTDENTQKKGDRKEN